MGVGHCGELLRTVVIIEPLTRLGAPRLDVCPDPRGPIPEATPPYGLRGEHAGVFPLRQGLAQFLFGWPLVPTEHRPHALAVAQVEANPLGFAPRVSPARPSRPVARWPGAAPARALRARRPLGPSNPAPQHRTANMARGSLSHAPSHLLARWRPLHHPEACGPLMRYRVQALTPDRHPTQPAQQRRGRLRRYLSGEVHRGLWHGTLYPSRPHVPHRVERRGPLTAAQTIQGGPRTFDSAPQSLDAVMPRATGGQPACTWGTGPRRSMLCLLLGGLHDRLGHATRPLLPYSPYGLAPLASGGRARWQHRLQLLEPRVEALMQPLAQRGPVLPCTHLVSRDNLSTTHG